MIIYYFNETSIADIVYCNKLNEDDKKLKKASKALMRKYSGMMDDHADDKDIDKADETVKSAKRDALAAALAKGAKYGIIGAHQKMSSITGQDVDFNTSDQISDYIMHKAANRIDNAVKRGKTKYKNLFNNLY